MNTIYIWIIFIHQIYTQPQQFYVNPGTVGNMPS